MGSLGMSTLLRFARSRAYSSRTSCSRGVQAGGAVDGGADSAIVFAVPVSERGRVAG